MAIDADTGWVVRASGNNDNGGGFVAGASGTDYANQNAAEASETDGECDDGSTTFTSAADPFTSAMVGNLLHVTAGTDAVTGWYEIKTYVDSGEITIDRTCASPGNNAQAVEFSVGGALASPGYAMSAIVADGLAGNVLHINGNHTLTTSTPNINAGPIQVPVDGEITIDGYQTTYWDGGTKPVIDAGVLTGIKIVEMLNPDAGAASVIYNVKCDGNGNATVNGIALTTVENKAINCEVEDCVNGINLGEAFGCTATGCSTSGFYLMIVTAYCVADTCATGYYGGSHIHCMAQDCTARGFWTPTSCYLINCTAHDNGSHGFDCTAGNTTYVNCLSTSNSGFGYDFDAAEGNYLFNCASYNNSSGRTQNFNQDISPILVLVDPYESESTEDYRPNDIATGGALLRDAGFTPGFSVEVDVGYARPELGVVGGGGLFTHPGMSGGMRG